MEKQEAKNNPIDKTNTVDAQAKIEMMKELKIAKSTTERVNLFGKVMDTYGVDALVGLIPALGDASSSIASSMYLLYEGQKMGLSSRDSLKILGYQTADALVGVVPVIGDIADYFFKADKRSAELFTKHFEKLKKEALEKGVSSAEIAALEENNNKFIKVISKNIPTKKKTNVQTQTA
ncbi:MAG: DUF4112 domain-containing protein [candidate division SR1 bacterium]|nr:DUF4112 domain-containing protein [candidate division SR1 bacterium]